MKRIDLINISKSDVKFEVTVFPDGEPHVKFLEDIDRKDEYEVFCRITNPSELFVLMQVGDILNRQGVVFKLVITYLMSQRMDRVVNFTEAFSLKIVADMINSLGAKDVYIFEAHSNRTFDLIKNSHKYDPFGYSLPFGVTRYTLCYPDRGAYERYCNDSFAEVIILNKKRDLANYGKIISIDVVSEPEHYVDDTIFIVDDLCDAGGTFVWSSKILREKYPNKKLGIFVRHLVNPIGLTNLVENFDYVVITDSYRDWDEAKKYDNVKVVSCLLPRDRREK